MYYLLLLLATTTEWENLLYIILYLSDLKPFCLCFAALLKWKRGWLIFPLLLPKVNEYSPRAIWMTLYSFHLDPGSHCWGAAAAVTRARTSWDEFHPPLFLPSIFNYDRVRKRIWWNSSAPQRRARRPPFNGKGLKKIEFLLHLSCNKFQFTPTKSRAFELVKLS